MSRTFNGFIKTNSTTSVALVTTGIFQRLIDEHVRKCANTTVEVCEHGKLRPDPQHLKVSEFTVKHGWIKHHEARKKSRDAQEGSRTYVGKYVPEPFWSHHGVAGLRPTVVSDNERGRLSMAEIIC